VQNHSFKPDTERYFKNNGGKPKKNKKPIEEWELEILL
jgi:hypothetical protein